jgi:putative DNA primase/helicase
MGIERSEERASQFVKFIQTAIGYSLVGVTTEKTVFLCHGSGDNGKTTLLEIIREIISAYSSTINIESLMSKNLSNNEAADLANLRGARFVRSSETEQGQRLNEARLKRITQGAGIIRACKKYEDWFEFPESHTLWVDANHKPVVRGQDPAIWNRLTLIPFEVSIPKNEQDPKLREKLLNEAEGILAWAIAGAVRWNNEGLQRPTEVLDAIAEWRATSDPINDFISDCCEIIPDTWTTTGILWDAYSKWTEENGIDPLSRNIFSVRIGGLGYTHGRRKSAGKIFRTVEGLKLR